MKKSILTALAATGLLLPAGLISIASATTIVDNSTYGYYNDKLGDFFYVAGDPTVTFTTAPDLSLAASGLGNWLSNPSSLNSSWTATAVTIPSSWKIYDETAIIYKFDGGATGLTDVVAKFGVDNGIFVWLDGAFLKGWQAAGGSSEWEYSLDLGSLSAGVHYLQILREDHGGATDYDVLVTGEAAPVPEPATMLLFGTGLAGLATIGRRKIK